MPPEGQNVIVTLQDGTEVMAYWRDGQWWVGVENDPLDAPLQGTVIDWRLE
jgi:hypothetical protein